MKGARNHAPHWAPLLMGGLLVGVLMGSGQRGGVTAAAIEKRNVESSQFSLKEKRPFCNAFTGCGRKRSAVAAYPEGVGEGAGGLSPDRRAELDEMALHVLAQARLWNQLQQRVEMVRALESSYPAPGDAPGPLYRRKREVVEPLPAITRTGGLRAATATRKHKRAHQHREEGGERGTERDVTQALQDMTKMDANTTEQDKVLLR